MANTHKKLLMAKILECWYSTDSILFNNHARNIIQEGTVYKEYITLKASLLSNLFEYWCKIGYSPKDTFPKNEKALMESAVIIASRAKKLAASLIGKESFQKNIQQHIVNESKKHDVKDIVKFTDKLICEKFVRISLDNILIGLPMLESNNVPEKNNIDFSIKMLEEAHKTLRNSIIHLALSSKKVNECGPCKRA